MNYSYDSPLLERIKEEEEVKAINVFKQNTLGHSQSLKRVESPPVKSKTLRLDLFSNNFSVIFVVLTQKNNKFKGKFRKFEIYTRSERNSGV